MSKNHSNIESLYRFAGYHATVSKWLLQAPLSCGVVIAELSHKASVQVSKSHHQEQVLILAGFARRPPKLIVSLLKRRSLTSRRKHEKRRNGVHFVVMLYEDAIAKDAE